MAVFAQKLKQGGGEIGVRRSCADPGAGDFGDDAVAACGGGYLPSGFTGRRVEHENELFHPLGGVLGADLRDIRPTRIVGEEEGECAGGKNAAHQDQKNPAYHRAEKGFHVNSPQ
jgi:hypothetical protein